MRERPPGEARRAVGRKQEQQAEALRPLYVASPCAGRIPVSHPTPRPACAGSPACHHAHALRGPSERPGPGPWAPPPRCLTPSRQMLTRLTSAVWQAQPPSIMGLFFPPPPPSFLKTRSEQGGIQRNGMQPAGHNATYRLGHARQRVQAESI